MMTKREEIAKDLVSAIDIEHVFQKHIVDGASYFFREFLQDVNKEYELRHEIATALKISINDVIIIGSAKLGFSVKNENFVEFDEKYKRTYVNKNKSDIDIAIINKKYFDKEAETIFELSNHFSPSWIEQHWMLNAYYKSDKDIKLKGLGTLFENYVKYLARGWLRPDFAPSIYIAQLGWNEIIDRWYVKLLQRKITIGVYSDWYYLKHYQMDNLLNLRRKIKNLEIPLG